MLLQSVCSFSWMVDSTIHPFFLMVSVFAVNTSVSENWLSPVAPAGVCQGVGNHSLAPSLPLADWTKNVSLTDTWLIPVLGCDQGVLHPKTWSRDTRHKQWVWSRKRGWHQGSGAMLAGVPVHVLAGDVKVGT